MVNSFAVLSGFSRVVRTFRTIYPDSQLTWLGTPRGILSKGGTWWFPHKSLIGRGERLSLTLAIIKRPTNPLSRNNCVVDGPFNPLAHYLAQERKP